MVIALHNIAVEHEYLKQVSIFVFISLVSTIIDSLQEGKGLRCLCTWTRPYNEQKDGSRVQSSCDEGNLGLFTYILDL
jgi:hypothetical protein